MNQDKSGAHEVSLVPLRNALSICMPVYNTINIVGYFQGVKLTCGLYNCVF